MKTKFDSEDLNLVSLAKEYSNEKKARKLFESLRWPDGKPICPFCKFNESYKIVSKPDSKNKRRAGLYCCAACRKTYTATVGTAFEDSRVPISKWLMAIFIICSSKKSVSAMQLSRMLKVTYKTAWFMAHRVRFSMGTDLKTAKPFEKVVEMDETVIGGLTDIPKSLGNRAIMALIVERDGNSRTQIIPTVSAHNVGKFLNEAVSKKAVVNTDEHAAYPNAAKDFAKHERVNHSRYEYARHNPDGTVSHINTCESWFSLMKRSVYGAWHSISRQHLPKYASEVEFRWNTRKVTDGERMAAFMPMIEGKRLMYRQPAN